MRNAIRRTLCVFVLSLVAVCGAQAQSQAVPGDIKAFGAQYVAALNSKDAARLLALQHPKSLACMTPENKDFYDWTMAMQMRESIPANYMLSAMPPNENNLKALESMGEQWPIKPAQEIHIDYQQGDDSGSVVVWLVRENGRWLGDFPCATDAAIKEFHDGAAARKAAEARYKALADGIKEPLRSELLAMLRAHETGRATDRYHAATGHDERTSMLVINALKDETR